MQITPFDIEGPLLITPKIHADERGYFFESFNQRQFEQVVGREQEICFVQDNQSRSVRNVIRGLHYQINPYAQGKLVRCLVGKIFDVAVDIRKNSSTYGRWVSAVLSSENRSQLWVPVGFAHGFMVLSCEAEVAYKTTDYWNKSSERSIAWNDQDLRISWPIPPSELPLISAKDAAAPSFKYVDTNQLVFV